MAPCGALGGGPRFDPDVGHVMAHFREWAVGCVENSKRPSEVFEVIDRYKRKKLSHGQFVQVSDGIYR